MVSVHSPYLIASLIFHSLPHELFAERDSIDSIMINR